MKKLIISGRKTLSGEVSVGGAKNSILPLLFSALLAEGEHVFHNVPYLSDVFFSLELLKKLGCSAQFSDSTLRLRVGPVKNFSAHYDVVRKMRASLLCLGPLLSRYGQAQISLPGGCAIGLRPVNLHIEALKALGATIELSKGYLIGEGSQPLKGSSFSFPQKSVGATENLLMAASMAEGTTVIENAAQEPEILDLACYLNKMGASISGAGTSRVLIKGTSSMKPAEHRVIPDRIETGTLLLAGAITKGQVTVKSCEPKHLTEFLRQLRKLGFRLEMGSDHITIDSCKEWKGVSIKTAPYPGFPTDLQAQFMALTIEACGTSVIVEDVFENRFMHIQEFLRMNASITSESHTAIVRGKPGCLRSAPVMATDLRASAGLVLAGLAAQGETHIHRIYHLERGYEQLEAKLSRLGAKISVHS